MTRSLFWCSALLALAACGGAGKTAVRDPFAYAAVPVAVRDAGVGHGLGRAAFADQVAWQAAELGLR